ncbi:ninjurin-B-like [Lycorma delicatula]|uniref:ninjurin-B-like n=1 Tax=Lycorma delicatula TaxID=130591 RepID=UPI003F50E5D1
MSGFVSAPNSDVIEADEKDNKETEIYGDLKVSIIDNNRENISMEELPFNETKITQEEIIAAKKSQSRYERKKTIAHGMMDTALISANANQLKFIILQYYNGNQAIMIVLIVLIVLSLIIQIGVGIALIFRHKRQKKELAKVSNGELSIDDYVIIGVFLVIIINIFIAAFTVGDTK